MSPRGEWWPIGWGHDVGPGYARESPMIEPETLVRKLYESAFDPEGGPDIPATIKNLVEAQKILDGVLGIAEE